MDSTSLFARTQVPRHMAESFQAGLLSKSGTTPKRPHWGLPNTRLEIRGYPPYPPPPPFSWAIYSPPDRQVCITSPSLARWRDEMHQDRAGHPIRMNRLLNVSQPMKMWLYRFAEVREPVALPRLRGRAGAGQRRLSHMSLSRSCA